MHGQLQQTDFHFVMPVLNLWLICFRFGQKAGFKDIEKGQLHVVAMSAQQKSGASVHENVIGYDDSLLLKTSSVVQKAEFLDCR